MRHGGREKWTPLTLLLLLGFGLVVRLLRVARPEKQKKEQRKVKGGCTLEEEKRKARNTYPTTYTQHTQNHVNNQREKEGQNEENRSGVSWFVVWLLLLFGSCCWGCYGLGRTRGGRGGVLSPWEGICAWRKCWWCGWLVGERGVLLTRVLHGRFSICSMTRENLISLILWG